MTTGAARTLGAGAPITIDGVEYRIPAATLGDLAQVEAKIRAGLPDLISRAADASAGRPAEVQERLLAAAMEATKKQNDITLQAIVSFCDQLDGLAYLIKVILERAHPDSEQAAFPLSSIVATLHALDDGQRARFAQSVFSSWLGNSRAPAGSNAGANGKTKKSAKEKGGE